jgi:DNA-directed RNA polymerase specialized sigma24 family protein
MTMKYPSYQGGKKMKRLITRREFGSAYETGRRQTEHFLLSRGLNEDEAREKAQAAWAKGWERRFQLKDKEKALSWINTIALNLYRSSIRKDSHHVPIREISVPSKVSLFSLDLDKMLARCRKSEYQILKLRYLQGHCIKDLSKLYGCTETAIRVKLFRARKSLRAKYIA